MIDKITDGLKFIWATLIYIIYPPLCPLCHEIVDEQNELCQSCANEIFQLNLMKKPPEILSGVLRITKYRGGSREILGKLKFDNDLTPLPALQNLLNEIANSDDIKNFLGNVDVATYVPLHADRLKDRGYNQTELIFRDWLIAQGITAENLLIRQKSTPKLFSYNAEERREILKGAFSLSSGVNVRGKNILIVDDIYTTGATVCGCAEVLKNAGAAKIFVLAFASDFED